MAGFTESSDFISFNEDDEVPSQGVELPDSNEGVENLIYEALLQEIIYENVFPVYADMFCEHLFPPIPTTPFCGGQMQGAFKPDGVPERCVMDHEPTGEEDIVSLPVSSADSNGIVKLHGASKKDVESQRTTGGAFKPDGVPERCVMDHEPTGDEDIVSFPVSSADSNGVVKLHSASEKDVESQRTTGDTTVTEPMDEGESQKASTNVTSLSVLPLNKPTCSKENNCSVPQEDGAVEQSRPKKRRANSTNVTGPSILPLNKPSCSKENNSSVPHVDGAVELSRPKKRRAKSESAMQSRKRSDGKPHLYDMPPFKDPKKEKARKKAVITRNYRVQEKRQFDEVIDENNQLKEQIANMEDVIDNLNQQIVDVTDERDSLKQTVINAERDNIKPTC